MQINGFRFPLPIPTTLPPGRLVVIFERTRSTIRDAHVTPTDLGVDVSLFGDRGVEIIGRPSDSAAAIDLIVDVVGEPVRIEQHLLLQSGVGPGPVVIDGWIVVDTAPDPTTGESVLDKVIDVRAAILERRRKINANPSHPLDPHRLFFLRVDEWTDLRCLTRPPHSARLPKEIKVSQESVVLEALNDTTLVSELTRWVKVLWTNGNPIRMAKSGGNTKYSPHEWAVAMASYLKQVLEYAFHESFKRPVVTGGGSIDPDFRTAFEQFANGRLGEFKKGLPESPILFPNSAYYFSFAAFAWVAKDLTQGKDRTFWEAMWPLWAYTGEIYRRRFTPKPAGGRYDQYTLDHLNAAVSDADIESLRTLQVDPLEFREILRLAFGESQDAGVDFDPRPEVGLESRAHGELQDYGRVAQAAAAVTLGAVNVAARGAKMKTGAPNSTGTTIANGGPANPPSVLDVVAMDEVDKLGEFAKWLFAGNAAIAALATAFGSQTLELRGCAARTLFDLSMFAFAVSAALAVASLCIDLPQNMQITEVRNTRRWWVRASAAALVVALVFAAVLHWFSRSLLGADPLARIKCTFDQEGAFIATLNVEELTPKTLVSLQCVHEGAGETKLLRTCKGMTDRKGQLDLELQLRPPDEGRLIVKGSWEIPGEPPAGLPREVEIPLR